MSKGFVPAYSFHSGSQQMTRNIDQWVNQNTFTRNENVYSVNGVKLNNIPLSNIESIKQALRDRKRQQTIERERYLRLHRQ